MIRSAQAMKRMHIWCAAAACTNFGRCEIQPSLLLAQKACAKSVLVGQASKRLGHRSRLSTTDTKYWKLKDLHLIQQN